MAFSHEMPTGPFKNYDLNPEEELRVHGVMGYFYKVCLIGGRAEIFGVEMWLHREYVFPTHRSISIFSWHGCKLKLVGAVNATQEKDTNTIIKVHLHSVLEERRIKAEIEDTRGPVVLVVGPTDIGKSTLCRVLLNYAAQMGRKPFFVDLDVGQNSISLPGTIGLMTVSRPEDIELGFDKESVQVLPFGHKTPSMNNLLYFHLIQKLGRNMKEGLATVSAATRHSGVIINTDGWVRSQGYNAITLAAMSFQVDTVFVISEERLYLQLKHDMPSCVEVVYLPLLDGVMEREPALRAESRNSKIREYFYGLRSPIPQFTFQVPSVSIHIFQIHSTYRIFDDAEHINMDEQYIVKKRVPSDERLLNQVLAVSSVKDSNSKDVILGPVLGFVCVVKVDAFKGKKLKKLNKITFLSPASGPLPSKVLILGSLEMVSVQ